jgi:hypothetical protein
MCALPTDRQTSAVANATIGSDVHETLDVHRDFGAERSLDANVLFDCLTQTIRVSIVQVADALVGRNAGALENSASCGPADSKDVRQPDLELLLPREIYSCDTRHASALPLLVFWIALADDASHAISLDDLAVLADRLNAASNFHVLLQ